MFRKTTPTGRPVAENKGFVTRQWSVAPVVDALAATHYEARIDAQAPLERFTDTQALNFQKQRCRCEPPADRGAALGHAGWARTGCESFCDTANSVRRQNPTSG